MICNKCKNEIQEDSAFCNYCGAVVANNNSKERGVFKNKAILILVFSILVGASSFLLFLYFTNPIREYQNEIVHNNSSAANKLYSEKIQGDVKREEKIKSFLLDEIAEIDNSFIKKKITYDVAKSKLNSIKDTRLVSEEVKNSIEKVEKMNNSRIAYKKAKGFQGEKNYSEAIKNYKVIIEEDENYEEAQKQIESIAAIYETDILKRAEESANTQDFKTAVSLLKEASTLIKDSDDITAKLAVYEKKLEEKNEAERKLIAEKNAAERKRAIEQAKKEQLVVVESSRIIEQSSEYKTLYPDMIQAIIKNNSDKTIKSIRVSNLGFDNNGYPIKIEPHLSLSRGAYEFIGTGEDVNIIAGGTFGQNEGWSLDSQHGISKVLSCVQEVTFYDGTTWRNPYYEYWIEEYKEKPLN